MKSRKLTVIIVSLCMCVSVLSGCGSTAEKEQVQHAAETQTATAEPDTSLEDGEYTVNVELEGGSGRASVDSEAKVKVTDGQAYATIVWSSTYYDYMLVDGKKYTNENEGGNSTFTFPIAGVPCTMDVVGDTTAMSQPHEIDYTLTFSFAKDVSFKELKQTGQVKLSYADQFQIDEYGNYKLITIVDNGRFLLIPKGVPVPADVPEDVTVLQQPLNHVYLVSSAVMDLICQTGGLSHVAYTALKEDDWYVQQAKDAMADGSLVYAGKYSAPDYELILSQGCDLAVENTMIYHSPAVLEQLERLGIPVLVETSSYETQPMGRMEWIKLYAALLDKEDEAEALFNEKMDSVADVLEQQPTGKTVAFFYITSSGAVNVRKSTDYVAKCVAIAGGDYVSFDESAEDNAQSTVNIQMESFYHGAVDADVLIYNSIIDGELHTLDELVALDPLMADFKAVKSGNVWCLTKNFYQESLELSDLILDVNHALNDAPDTAFHFLTRMK